MGRTHHTVLRWTKTWFNAEKRAKLAKRKLKATEFSAARSLDELADVVRDKSIALVGNSTSLLTAPHNIDAHDVVIRMNRGIYVARESNRLGKKTDVLLCSVIKPEMKHLVREIRHVMWMSRERRHMLNSEFSYYAGLIYLYPIEWWEELYVEIGSRPSCGAMGIDLLSRFIGSGEIKLYGFDFWRSPTTYTGSVRTGPHCPAAEESFARRRVPNNFSE